MSIDDLRDIIALGTGKQLDEINESDRLDTLGLSSFDVMVITSLIENKLHVDIDISVLTAQMTVQDLLSAVSILP